MAFQSIGLGSTADDGTDTIRVGGDKINDNFTGIYTLLGTGTALTSGLGATSSVVTLVVPSITGVASFADGSASVHQLQTRVIQILVYSLVQQMRLRLPREHKDLKSMFLIADNGNIESTSDTDVMVWRCCGI